MGFLTNIKKAYEEHREQKQMELEEEEKQSREIEDLLDKFEVPDLEKLCENVIGDFPESEIEEQEREVGEDKVEVTTIEHDLTRQDYLGFIWEHLEDEKIKYKQLQDFALKNRIVSPSFFGDQSSSSSQVNYFESIVNTIRDQFEPEKIDSEEHLEAQLMIFLKAKFSDRKISRQVEISPNERLDILIDDKYAFELKVPDNRSVLRNLGAQIEEYSQKYPQICAVIFEDTSRNLTNDINEYVDKYKRNYGIPSIVIRGEKKG